MHLRDIHGRVASGKRVLRGAVTRGQRLTAHPSAHQTPHLRPAVAAELVQVLQHQPAHNPDTPMKNPNSAQAQTALESGHPLQAHTSLEKTAA
jgi:hypothetical protein